MPELESNIRKMYVFNFLLSMHFIGGVLVPFFLDWGQITFTQIMLLQSFFVICIFALEVPTGAVADRFGRKSSLVLGAIINSIAALIYASVPNFYIFMVGEFLWALGAALESGADEAIIYDSLKGAKKEYLSKSIFGRVSSFGLAALMISAPIGSLIASTLGVRYTMIFLSIPMAAGAIVGLTFKEPKIETEIGRKKYFDTIVEGMKYFKDHSILKILAFDRIMIGNLAFLIIWTYQPLLKTLGVPLLFFGFIHAGMTGIEIVFLNSFKRFETLIGSKKRYLTLSALIPGFSFIVLGMNDFIPLTIVLLLFITGFGLTRRALFQSYMNKYIESHNRATVVSTISMVDQIVRAALYPLLGLLVDWSLNYALIIIGTIIIMCSFLSRIQEEHLID